MHATVSLIKRGGICILPSDTCYAVAVDPMRRGVTTIVDKLLGRHHAPISVSFGSQRMMERFVHLGFRELRILDDSTPSQAVTLVAPIREETDGGRMAKALSESLFGTPGFLGARLPFSFVERQLSTELDKPITTIALYYPDGSPVKCFDDAIDIVVDAAEQRGIEINIIALRHPVIRSSGVSTVFGFAEMDGCSVMVIYREGEASANRLKKVAEIVTPRDVEDWT